MDCQAVSLELVAYVKGELASHDASEVERHLAACEHCRQELAHVQATFRVLEESLAPVELSADFRMNLMGRLQDAMEHTQEHKTSRGTSARSASIRLLQSDTSWTQHLWDQIRRSPYVAASFALHAAALLMIGVLIGLQVNPRAPRVHIETPADPAQPDAFTEYHTFTTRQNATRIRTQTVRTENGDLDVDLSRLRHTASLVLQPEWGVCLRAYIADEEGAPTQEQLMTMYPKATPVTVQNGHLVLPVAVQLPGMESTKDLLVLAMDNRLEFWQPQQWDDYKGNYLALAWLSTPLVRQESDAILPRREELV